MSKWGERRSNYTTRSYGIRRAFRRANRVRLMPAAHWQAYLYGATATRQLIHKGGKP